MTETKKTKIKVDCGTTDLLVKQCECGKIVIFGFFAQIDRGVMNIDLKNMRATVDRMCIFCHRNVTFELKLFEAPNEPDLIREMKQRADAFKSLMDCIEAVGDAKTEEPDKQLDSYINVWKKQKEQIEWLTLLLECVKYGVVYMTDRRAFAMTCNGMLLDSFLADMLPIYDETKVGMLRVYLAEQKAKLPVTK